MHALPDTWTIRVDDDAWPHTLEPAKTVTVHSPYSGMQFGAWGQGPAAHRIRQENWRVLGHELCGHAWLMVRGLHPSGPPPTHGGRPSHDATVTIENRIAAEHGIPASELRGLFADPHHGESFARVDVVGFPRNSAHISDLPASAHRQLDIAEAFAVTSRVPVKMDVIGHADQSGSDASNAAISLRRARRVKKELVSRGVGPGRFLTVRGAGASECAAPGDQPDCRNASIFMFLQEGASETHV
jgi:outer membrane protein OmpA-like peptidoglycan-associated protein